MVYVPFSVSAMAWLGEHRAFVVEEFIRNGGSVITTPVSYTHLDVYKRQTQCWAVGHLTLDVILSLVVSLVVTVD